MIKVSEIRPNIYRFEFDSTYNMAMHFLRYQEYYESPSSKFRNSQFTIFDFMEWYSKEYGNGNFTYPGDWGGFNLPGFIIKDVHNRQILDYNKYDKNMFTAYRECFKKSKEKDFYVIACTEDETVMKHEIAHGFYFINYDYMMKAQELVNKLEPSFRNAIFNELKEVGYASSVFIDEAHAYLATGMLEDSDVKLNGEDAPFIELFNEYYKGNL